MEFFLDLTILLVFVSCKLKKDSELRNCLIKYQGFFNLLPQACRGNELDKGHEIPVSQPRFTPGIRPVTRTMPDGGDGATDNQDNIPENLCDTPTSSSVDPPKFHQKVNLCILYRQNKI